MPSLPPGPPPAWGPGTPARRGARARGRGRERGPQTSPRWGPRRGAHSGGRHPHPSPSAQAPVKPDPFPTRGPEGRAAYQRLAPPDSAERARAGNQGREGAQRVGGAFWGETGRCPPKAGGGSFRTWTASKAPHPLSGRFPPSAALRAPITLGPASPWLSWLCPGTWRCPQETASQARRTRTNIPTPGDRVEPRTPQRRGRDSVCSEGAAFQLGLQELALRAGVHVCKQAWLLKVNSSAAKQYICFKKKKKPKPVQAKVRRMRGNP